jgi:hypothetical protein
MPSCPYNRSSQSNTRHGKNLWTNERELPVATRLYFLGQRQCIFLSSSVLLSAKELLGDTVFSAMRGQTSPFSPTNLA